MNMRAPWSHASPLSSSHSLKDRKFPDLLHAVQRFSMNLSAGGPVSRGELSLLFYNG